MFETEPLVESQQRTIRGNRFLIALRLLLATIALTILLLQESLTHGDGREGLRLPAPEGEVTALEFSSNGSVLFSGGSDATVRAWDVASESEKLATIEGHGNIVTQVALSRDGSRLASSSMDGSVRLYAASTGNFEALLKHDGPVLHLAWSPDGTRLVAGTGAYGLYLWEVSAKEPKVLERTGEDPKGQDTCFAAFLDAERLVTAGQDGAVRFWSVSGLRVENEVDAHIRPILAAAISPNRKWMVTGGLILRLWNLEEKRVVRASEAHGLPISALGFCADNEHFFSAGRDRRLLFWSVGERRELKAFGEHADWVLSGAISPDGKTIATGTGDRIIRLWDVATGEERQKLVGHRPTLRAAYAALPQRREAAPAVQVPLYLQPEGLVVVIVLLLTILYTWALRRAELAPKLASLQIFVDIGLVSALVYHTGGVDSPFVTLYLIGIVAAAFVLSWRGAILVAAFTATAFSLLTLSYGLGYIPENYLLSAGDAQLRKFRDLSPVRYFYLLIMPIAAFFLVAVLSGRLSRSLTVARLLHHEVLEGLGEGILVLGASREVVYHNNEVMRLLAVEGVPVRASLRELLGDHVDQQARKSFEEDTGRRIEISHRRPDGIILPFEVKIKPFSEPGQPPHALIVVVHDITAEKKMEEFFKHKERLDAMGQISASIAHEIRNPLASIRGAVQEIARSVEIPESKKILIEIVLSESDRLDHIITDFLKYARMRSPRLVGVELTELLRDLRLMLVSRAEAKDIQISLEADEEVDPIRADPEQLRQIFLNFGVNAMQALDGCAEKKIVFRVRKLKLHDLEKVAGKAIQDRVNRPGVLVEIEDSGPGIPRDVLEQIFEPFFTTKPSGTGLGLAIADRIVQGHEGVIKVKSEEGRGATFQVWLPSDLQGEEEAPRGAGTLAERMKA
ncbi:MAG: ATP-binding protein [Planctomycetota bacterium]|nr:ATP-binding protein [Planctomycetota bacterium]